MKKTNSWNRLLSLVLCLCMVLSLIPALQWPVSAVGASAPVVDGSHIYAQGTPLYIVAGTSSGTAIYYLNGSQKVYLNSNGAAGDDMSGTMVWGGYRENALDGDVNITMTGGKISRINGTGYDYYNTAGGYVNNVNITISGGTVSDAINAGWRNPVNGNVNITMTGGSVGKIYGCCSFSQASVGNADVKVCGNVNLRITGGSVSTIHGGDGYNPVHGTVSAVVLVPTNLVHYGISSDEAYYFDNVLYLNGSTWTQKGSVTLNAGDTLTVAAGQTLTLKGSLTNKGTIINNGTVNMSGAWTNNGTFINNGTLNKTYAISGNAIQNSGTVNYNAAYIEGISSVSSISAKMDGNAYSLSSDMYQVVSGRLYVWLPSGNAEVTVNGSQFYGITAVGKQTQLIPYVGVNGITGIPEKIDANRNYTLSASVLPETGIIFPQTVTYELVSSTAPGTTLTDGVLYAAGAGSAKIRITARDSYVTYSTTVDVEVLFTPVTGLTKALDDVIYTGAYELPGVTPGDASYSGIVWTVVSAGTTGATINGSTLTTTGTGTLKLRGTVQNGLAYGSNYVVEKTVTVKTIDYIDLTYGSVSISKKDDTTVTVTYTPFGGDGTRDYSVNERIYITGTSTENHITVVSGNPKIALSNVNLNLWAFEEEGDPGAFHIASGANVDLELIGTNTLKSGRYNAGLSVPSGASVVIGGDGALNAYGGGSSAGIGGSYDNNCGTVTINSGIITAASFYYENRLGSGNGSGIGGGYFAAGGTITINGGNVFAMGDSGIGSGANGYRDRVGTVTINGGTVFASAQPDSSVSGAAIGGGYRCAGYNVIINGGSVKTAAYRTHIGAGITGSGNGTLKDSSGNAVTLHTFTLNGAAADTAISAVSGISYGINDVRTQDTDKLYFYLPSGSDMPDYFTAGDTIYCGGENNVYSAETHRPGKTYFIDGDTHYNKCSVCDSAINVTEHSGGVADCLHEGTCQFCGAAYLPVDPNNHTSTDTYLEYIDDEYHGTFRACCKAEVSRTEHTAGQVATCTGTAICADCGIAYGATDSANHTGQLIYVSNGKQNHIQIWDCCRTPNATPEPHTLTYTADGLTITGICDFCDANGKVTLKPSVGGTYNGYAFTSTYEGTDLLGSWDAFVKPTVSYCCEGGCKTAGTHTVTMTLGEASVSAEFTITPKTLTVGLVKASYKSYDGTSDLDIYSVSMDGVVVYDEGDYSGAWDDIRDDVQLVNENLVYTFDGIVPGTYSSVDVSGVTITGNDAANYVIAESFEDVPLRDSMGYDFEISNAQIWITAYDQLLTGDAELDQSQYAVEGLEDQFTIQGVSLYENSYSEIEIDPYSIGIYLDGEDVTEYFNITVHNGILSRVCEGHEYDDNGFCATGECNSYEPAVKNAAVDEWGNEIEVYEIYNAGQLYWFAEQVNTYGNNYINGKLMADITVNEDLTAENLRQWTPIGRAWPAYCAIFEGNDHTISGLYVNDPEMDYVGLFGYTDYAYPISNIHLTNSYFEGNSCVGGLVGYAGSNISGCTVSDSVTVKGNTSLGGIVGDTAYGELNNSWSAATVIANENAYYYGGLVGSNCMSINNCYTTGSSVVGYNNESYGGSVNNCYYLSEEETEDGGKTAAQFASGEVAYLLQSGVKGEYIGWDDELEEDIYGEPAQIWGQTIGEETYPVIGGMKVNYGYTTCDDAETAAVYTNSSEIYAQKPEHSWNVTDGVCTGCGDQAVLSVTIGQTVAYYDQLNDAILAVADCTEQDNAVVKLYTDFAMGDTYLAVESGVFTLDLNGNLLTGDTLYGGAIRITGGNVTITSSVPGGEIKVDHSQGSLEGTCGVLCTAGETTGVTVRNIKITLITENSGVAAGVFNATESLTLDGVTIDSDKIAILTGFHTEVIGGSLEGRLMDLYVVLDGTITLRDGVTFPDGIKVPEGGEEFALPVNSMLGEGMAYWQNGAMLTLSDDALVISGPVTVKAACTHDWQDATCTAPKTCPTCGATEGEALGHSWTDATCTAPKTCGTCGTTEGEALGHSFVNGGCESCDAEIQVSLPGSFNGWDTSAWVMTRGEDGIYTYEVRLESGSYTFKVMDDGNWLGNNGTISDDTAGYEWIFGDGGDCTISASGGTYTFLYNINTKGLKVEAVLDHVHDYDLTFTWSDYYTTCTAAGSCGCGNSVSESCVITKTLEDGKLSFTAAYGDKTDTVTVDADNTNVVYVDVSAAGWTNVNAYYWMSTSYDAVINWPGIPMTHVRDSIYCIEVPADCDMIIFNDGYSQTDDLKMPVNGENIAVVKSRSNVAWGYVAPLTYSITFTDEPGMEMADWSYTITKPYGAPITEEDKAALEAAIPVIDYYSIMEWFTLDNDEYTPWEIPATMPGYDQTVYAYWEGVRSTVSFYSDPAMSEDSYLFSSEFLYGEFYDNLEDFVFVNGMEDYAPEGYHVAAIKYADGTDLEFPYTHGTEDLDLYVEFAPDSCETHTEEVVPGYAATCTEPGLTDGVICTVCGETITAQEEIPATGHSYENYVCTVCGHVPVKLETAALSYKETIVYNIFFTLGIDETVDLADMGLVMFDSLIADGTMDDAIATYSGAVEMNGMYMVATDGVHAKKMGDTIYFRAYAKLADGSYVYSKAVEYSAVTYANHILNSDKPDSDKALMVAMLNYGAEAQKYFRYNTENLVNAGLTDEQKALVKGYEPDLLASLTQPDSSKAGTFAATGTGFSKLAPAVSFEGRFVLNYFFTPSEAVVGDMTLYYWTEADYAAATELTAENASGSVTMLPGEQYRGIVDGIHAKDVDSIVYVAAVYSDGTTTHCTGVLAYSIGAYLKSQAAKETNFQPMAQAAAVYCSYCKEYFYG